jgi:hypothetical protein
VGAIPKRLSSTELQDRVERLGDIAVPLLSLKDTDGWRMLQKTFEAQKAKYYDDLTQSLMKKGAEIDQRELDYNRGFFASIEDLLEAPENAEKILRRASERLQKRREEEELISE